MLPRRGSAEFLARSEEEKARREAEASWCSREARSTAKRAADDEAPRMARRQARREDEMRRSFDVEER